jgi:hypothetical protein
MNSETGIEKKAAIFIAPPLLEAGAGLGIRK